MAGFHESIVHSKAPSKAPNIVPASHRERIDQLVEQNWIRIADRRDRVAMGDPLRSRSGEQLLEHRQCLSGRPTAGPDHQWQHPRLDRHTFVLTNTLQQDREGGRREEPKLEWSMRDRSAVGRRSGLSVVKMNTVRSGGSSTVPSRAFDAIGLSMCAWSKIKTRNRDAAGGRAARSRSSRMSS